MVSKLNRKINEVLQRWATAPERKRQAWIEEQRRRLEIEESQAPAPRSRADDEDPYEQLSPDNLDEDYARWQLEQSSGGHEYVVLGPPTTEIVVRPEQPVYLREWLTEWDHRVGVQIQHLDDYVNRLNGVPTRQEQIDLETQARRSARNVELAATVDVNHLFRDDVDDDAISGALAKLMVARAHNAATTAEDTMIMTIPTTLVPESTPPEEEPWS